VVLQNKKVIYDLLFRASAETLRRIVPIIVSEFPVRAGVRLIVD